MVFKSGLRFSLRGPEVPFLVLPKTPKMLKGDQLTHFKPALKLNFTFKTKCAGLNFEFEDLKVNLTEP